MSNEQTAFTGIWLPRDLLEDKRLTLADKLLIGYWSSFGTKESPKRCFQSDAAQAANLGLTEKTVANRISRLRKMGILKGRQFPRIEEIEFPKQGSHFPKSGRSSLNREVKLPGIGNIEQIGEQSKRAKIEILSPSTTEDRRSIKLTLTETEDLLAGLGIGASAASHVFDRLEAAGWRGADGQAFRSRERLEKYAAGLAEHMRGCVSGTGTGGAW